MTVIINPSGDPVELVSGGGDLRYASSPYAGTGNVNRVGGKAVSYGDIFASQPWVATAVGKMLGGAVRVPLKVYRRTEDTKSVRLRPGDHPLADAISNPWTRGTQAQLVQALLGPMLVHGNATTHVDSGADDAIHIEPVDYRTMTPLKAKDGTHAGWRRQIGPIGSKTKNLGLDDVMHNAWWSPLGPLGISPLQQLGTTIAIEDAAQRYQHATFANGAKPPSAITVDRSELPADATERAEIYGQLRADISNLYQGPDNSGRPALLPPGLDWKPIGHTAVEAELIDQRKVAREEIAAVYLIPPPMIGILDKATYSNIEVQRQMFYTDSLGAPLVLIEQMINAHIVRDLILEDDIYVEFDFGVVLRGDRLKEIQALREAIGIGLMKPNEGRGVLNLPQDESEGADSLWMPTNNLSPIDQAVSEAAERVKAAALGQRPKRR